ncbi:lipoprotein [Pseudomonas sp. DWRC2-2]
MSAVSLLLLASCGQKGSM